PQQRMDFLKSLLEFNGYTVIVVPSAPSKVAAKPVAPPAVLAEPNSDAQAPVVEIPLPSPAFTIGVTDVTFNPTNAIFGRLLHTRDGHVVTLAYWEEHEKESHDEIPYYENMDS
ncbi:MAG: hypothetical protein ABIQ74_08765, partial [Chitinophagales bacterium]